MKTVKKISAAVLSVVMLLSFAACHKKNETAVTVGKTDFSSAYYMCSLINADIEAKSKIDEEKSDKNASEETDYYSKKIDGKSFVKWVEDKAVENIKKTAAFMALCKENDIKISDEDIKTAETYADYYWNNYGYSALYEPNGVSSATYKEYIKNSHYSNYYFDHIYGAEGTKAISADDVKAKTVENFVLADVIDVTFQSETDEQKTEIKNKLENYASSIKSGSMTFEQAYKDYNGSNDDVAASDETQDGPKDKYAQLLGSDDTLYKSEYFKDVKAMANGEVKLITKEDNAGYYLAVKQDITADEYYLKNLDTTVRHLIADDDFNKEIDEYVKKLDVKVNKYAVSQFKVKKIKQPTA